MRTINCSLNIFSCLFLVSCFFCSIEVSHASSDTLRVGEAKRDWESLESSNKRFRLLFFTLDGSSSRYLGVQYVTLNGDQIKVVWFANRGKPLTDTSGNLTLTHEGNLVLNDYKGTVVTINAEQPPVTTSRDSITATLLDTGNLVLRAGEHIVWQSFDQPCDTWLPGIKLGLFRSSMGQIQQRSLTSWVSESVTSIGAFTFGINPNNTKELVIWQRGVVIWRSGLWNGYNFTNLFPGVLSFSYFSDESQNYFTYNDKNHLLIEMYTYGQIVLYHQNANFLDDIIDCWPKYRSKGCTNTTVSTCKAGDVFNGGESEYMSEVYNLNNDSLGLSDCRDICTKNCSCNAFASLNTNGTGCRFSHEIFDYGYYSGGNDIYIRDGTVVTKSTIEFTMPPAEAPTSTAMPPTEYTTEALAPSNWWKLPPSTPPFLRPDNSRVRQMWLAIGVPVASVLILTPVFLLCYLRWRNRNFAGNNGKRKDGTSYGATQSLMYELDTEATIMDKINYGKKDHELPLFTLSSIEIATDYFSDANKIGHGGFGPVYKGKFINGQEIAVKRLSRSSGQGLEEFKNEVILISRLQHRNLVRLLGHCSQGDERVLIYEYLPNKSLDSFLFDVTRRGLLDWKMRVCIIEGIAKGLEYLHKYSRLRIIHRDLKTSNILLDSNMNPKISDFGTARIFGDNESRANTNKIVGTYGYMSPEYALDGLFSVKSDVFSFGVMMLEIISGKKNTGFYQPDRALNLLGYAWDLWKDGRGLEIMDCALVEACPTRDVMRYIQVSFLCVQESAADRPTISEVVYMLNNETINIPIPKQPAFSAIVSVNHAHTNEIPKSCSVNDVTISEVEGR